MTDGIITAVTPDGTWAWCGAEVDSCSDLTRTTQFNELGEGDRYQKAITADANYLRQFLGAPHSLAVELRWIRMPGQPMLRLVVLGRVFGHDTATAVAMAGDLRQRLAHLPTHLSGHPIVVDEELAAVVNPFVPHPAGMIGITKRAMTARPERPDVRWARHFAVLPLNVTAQSWEDALRALYRRDAPTMIGVALEPMALSKEKLDNLGSLATQFTRFSQPTRVDQGGIAGGSVEYSPDAFAVFAAPIYQEACRRYGGATFRLRVSVASTAPIDDGFAEVLGGTISPPMDAGGAAGTGYAVSRFTRATALVERPADADAAQTFTSNIGSVGTVPWGPDARIFEGYDPPPAWMLEEFLRIVDVEEACAAFRLPAAVNGQMPGFRVVTPGAQHRIMRADAPSMDLGERLDGGVVGQGITIERDQVTRHALICGAAGTGKTNTTLGLCHQLWTRHKVPFFVIDPVKQRTDYRMLIDLPGMEDVVVLTGGSDRVAPFRINPFVVPDGVPPIEHCGSLLTSFKAAFGLWEPLPGIYVEALTDVYRDLGFVLDEPCRGHPGRGWPSLESFAAALEAVVEERGYPPEQRQAITAASVGRAKQLSNGLAARILDCDVSYPVEELLARPTVLELASLSTEPEAQSLVVGLILGSMTTYFKGHWTETKGLKHVTVIEEAHRLLSRPEPGGDPNAGNARKQAAEGFANSLAENRGYGEGIVIVEQVPTKLIEDAIKNSNLKVMHLLPGRDDQEEMAGAMGLTDDQVDFVPSLGQGEAYVSHDGLDRAVHVRMPLLEKPSTQPDDARLKARFDAVGGVEHERTVSLRPFVDCVDCTSPCDFRSRARSVVSRKSVPALAEIIHSYPADDNSRYRGPRPATPAHRTAWMDGLVEYIAALQPLMDDLTDAQVVDELTCRLIHLMRRSFRVKREGHVRSFRKALASRLAAATADASTPPMFAGPADEAPQVLD